MFHRNVNNSRTIEEGDANLTLDAAPGEYNDKYKLHAVILQQIFWPENDAKKRRKNSNFLL